MEPTRKHLVIGICMFAIIVITSGAIVISNPHQFVRIINMLLAIVISVFLGAFIRELFIQSNKLKNEK